MKKGNIQKSIDFLNKNEQRLILKMFISTSLHFFYEFKKSFQEGDLCKLKKKCHNYGSSLTALNLEDCLKLIESISIEINKNNLDLAYSLFLILEHKVKYYINQIDNL